MNETMSVAAVVPAYKVTDHILGVIDAMGPTFTHIFVVDDCCPDGSGQLVEKGCNDDRVTVIYNEQNRGVGGAVIAGYRRALEENIDVIVKVDGDGQMDPRIVKRFVTPILTKKADYAKGNRFQSLYSVRQMPISRLLGNAILSFMTKLSSGYWRLFDPTNGYTAIHKKALSQLDLDKLNERYFFETDMLIRLGDIRAVVQDVPMQAEYGTEVSGLKIHRVTGEFFVRHFFSTFRRIFYAYFLRDFSLASVYLFLGNLLFFAGVIHGGLNWYESISTGLVATTGTVMLSVLPIILGFQLIMFFLSYDISAEPATPLSLAECDDVSFEGEPNDSSIS